MPSDNRRLASPRARRLAAAAKVSLEGLASNSPDRRIHEADVIPHVATSEATAERELSRASRDIDASDLHDFCQQLKLRSRRGEEAPTAGDVLLKAAAAATRMHPQLSRRPGRLGIGQLASQGALWRALDAVDQRPLRQIAPRHRDLQDVARSGRPVADVEPDPPDVLAIDASPWQLTSLLLPLPAFATMLICLGQLTAASSANPDDSDRDSDRPSAIQATARLELVFNATKAPISEALAWFCDVVELMENPDWSLLS